MLQGLLSLLICFALLCGVSLFISACGSEAERESEAKQQVQTKSAVEPDGSIRLTAEQVEANQIQTAEVGEEDVASNVSIVGRVTPRSGSEAQVFSPFAGNIIANNANLPRVGSVVRRGQVIAQVERQFSAAEEVQINSSAAQTQATIADLQTNIEQGQQEIAFRQIELDRAKRLYAGGAIALKQVQTAEFTLRQAQAKVEGIKKTRSKYEAAQKQQTLRPRHAPIVVPLTGFVTVADLVAGMQADPSRSLLTIVDLSTVWVEAAVPESSLQSVRSATRAVITTPASPGRNYSGTLLQIGNVVDPNNRTVPVRFAVENFDGSLKIGMTTDVLVLVAQAVNALVIPASAVLFEEGQAIVFVETEPRVFRRRAVQTGERRGENIVVTDGLVKGEKVVSVGAGVLRSEASKGQIPSDEDKK